LTALCGEVSMEEKESALPRGVGGALSFVPAPESASPGADAPMISIFALP
jgi:hypothetical protein